MRDRASARLALGSLLILACVAAAPAPPAKRRLTHRDYDAWRSISSEVVSRDGRTLAYAFMPQDGDGELVVRDLTTGKERREPVGALPPPPVQQPEEVDPDNPLPRPRHQDRHHQPQTAAPWWPPPTPRRPRPSRPRRAEEEARRDAEGGLLVVNLATGEASRVPS